MGSKKKLRTTSQDEEQAKKKMAKRYEMDVESVIKQYDVQVKDMAFNLSEHQEAYKKEQRQLNELREHFEKVDEASWHQGRGGDLTGTEEQAGSREGTQEPVI